MEILVAAQPEESAIALGGLLLAARRQVGARAHQRGAGAMLQAAVAIGRDHGHEHVAAVAVEEGRGLGLGFEQADLRFTDLLQVAAHALQIELRHIAREHHVVLGATGAEAAHGEVAHLDGVIDQLVVVCHLVAAEAVALGTTAAWRLAHGRGDTPAGIGLAVGCMDVDRARLVFLPFGAEEDRAAVEEAVRGVQVRGAHGQVPGVDLIAERKRPVHRCRLPALLVQLGQCHRLAAGIRADAHDIACEVADHVAAGNPRRQVEQLAGGMGGVYRDGDGEQVRFRLKRGNGVMDRLHERDCSAMPGPDPAPAQALTFTTTRPRMPPSTILRPASIASDKPISRVMARRRSGTRSCDSRCQACSRRAIGAITLSMP